MLVKNILISFSKFVIRKTKTLCKFKNIIKIIKNTQMTKKRIILLLMLLIIIGFSIQLSKRKNINKREIETEKHQKSNAVQIFTIKSNTTIVNDRKWIVNSNVIQYSTLMLINTHNNTIRFESLALLNYKNTSIPINLPHLACLVRRNQVVLQINPSQLIRIYTWDVQNRFFYKIICDYEWNYTQIEEINVAIINVNEFRIGNKYFNFLHQNNSSYPKEYIQFQRVDIIDTLKPKIPKVAHCVHFSRAKENMQIKRLINWIEIQKLIGIDQITFYNYSMSDRVIKEIETKNYQDFVKIIQYKMDLDSICETQTKLTKNKPNSKLFKQMFEQCKSICDKHFNESEDIIIEIHGAINTNDCFTHYRYRYQFVTNYDVDELIIPSGSLAMYKNFTCLSEDFSNLNYSTNFNINHLSLNLFQKKHNMSQIACLQFEHVLFLNDDEFLNYFIKSLPFEIRGSVVLMNLKIANRSNIWYDVTKCDHVLVRDIKQSYELFKCLKSKYMNNSRLDLFFNNAIATMINIQEGKSIYNTDNTISIYQHSIDKATPNTSCIKVPLQDGYAGHFREQFPKDRFDKNYFYPLSYFQINIDYYKFLIKHFSLNISN